MDIKKMTMDLEIKNYLDGLAALNPPSLTELTIAQIRANTTGYYIPQPIRQDPDLDISNREMAVNNTKINFRIYRPKKDNSSLPCIVYFHGGGFFAGSLDHYDPFCVEMTKAVHCVVIAVDYRMAPEFPFPIPPEDCYQAALAVKNQAQSFNIIPEKIYVAGDSAGSALTCAVTFMFRDRQQQPLAGQILICPLTDDNYERASYRDCPVAGFTPKEMMWVWNMYLKNQTDFTNPYAIPMHEKDFSDLPPALILTAEYDALLDEGHAYAEKMRANNSLYGYHCYSGMIHGFTFLEKMSKAAQTATHDLLQRISRFIKESI